MQRSQAASGTYTQSTYSSRFYNIIATCCLSRICFSGEHCYCQLHNDPVLTPLKINMAEERSDTISVLLAQ